MRSYVLGFLGALSALVLAAAIFFGVQAVNRARAPKLLTADAVVAAFVRAELRADRQLPHPAPDSFTVRPRDIETIQATAERQIYALTFASEDQAWAFWDDYSTGTEFGAYRYRNAILYYTKNAQVSIPSYVMVLSSMP